MKNKTIYYLLLSICFFVLLPTFAQTTYYIDPEGDDDASGLSSAKAWSSLDMLNSQTFQAGDSILFKRGGSWTGHFEPTGSGSEGNRIVASSYGSGDLPVLDAAGDISSGQEYSSTVRLYNQEYWEFRDLHIKNYAPSEGNSPKHKYGILVEGKNCGTLHDFKFINLVVSDVNGDLDERKNGGIAMLISRSNSNETPSNYDGVLVENCHFLNSSRSGFFTDSEWKNRDFNSSFGETASNGKTNEWFPSFNIVVRNSHFEEIGGNGMVIRIADGPLVEHCLFTKCSKYTTGNASYPYNCDNALWQYNEACYTIYNEGDVDASGFDSDFFCKNTIIQYNYSHDNDWGSVLVCSNGNIERAFNDATIVRYNIFQNDQHHSFRISGSTTNTYIYNNIMYIGPNQDGTEILWHKSWGGYPDRTHYYNNIFYNQGSESTYNFTSSTHNYFSNNLFYGNLASNEPTDPNKVTGDPLFVDPGKGSMGFNTLDGYQIQAGSAAIDAGKNMFLVDKTDFFGAPFPSGSAVDIGAVEFQHPIGFSNAEQMLREVHIGPNPATNLTILDIENEYKGNITLKIYNSTGALVLAESFSKNSQLLSRVIKLEKLDPGMHFVKVSFELREETIRLLKL